MYAKYHLQSMDMALYLQLFYIFILFHFIFVITPQTPRFPLLLEEILRFSRNFLDYLFFKGFFPSFFKFTYTLNLLFMERFI